MGRANKIKGVKDILFDGLTKLEYEFVNEYLRNGANATQAMIKACETKGKSINYETAAVMANEYLSKPKLINYIDDKMYQLYPERWLENELKKDIKGKDKSLRINGLNNMVKIKGMITERRLDLTRQKAEVGEITYSGYAETPKTDKKDGSAMA